MSARTFLVTGGTGRIGTAFVHEIAARGHKLRLVTRDPEGAAARLRAHFGNVESVKWSEAAFEGVEGALLVPPFGDMAAWHTEAAAFAKSAGVRHLVKVSVTGAKPPSSPEFAGGIPAQHFAGEEALRASGVPSTMIRPTIFGQHFLGISPALFRPGDPSIHLPTGDARIAFLDCRDIAICAASILVNERADFAGRAFELTGPSALAAKELAGLLSLVGGRRIGWVDGMDAFSAHAKEIGASDRIKGIYGEAAGGWFAEVHDDEFREIVGRGTTSFAKLAFDHAAHFGAAS